MFLPQITVAILNFAQRQRATQKMYNGYLHLLQAQVKWIRDPPFVIGCLTENLKMRIPNP